MKKKNEMPPITHAEVVRRIEREVELCGGFTTAARAWKVTSPLLHHILAGRRSVGPKLLKALKLRRKRFVIYRYEEVARA